MRVGNAASEQFQLDVYGEVLDALHQAASRTSSARTRRGRWQRRLLGFLEDAWKEPDEGIWEVRGPRRHFTHSKVMAWVAFDRGVQAVERFDRAGPGRALARRCATRSTTRSASAATTPTLNSFTQSYGSKRLDASLLMIPLVGFLPADDPRMVGTVARDRARARPRRLRLPLRARRGRQSVDGLPPGEGAFLPCTFWLADNLALQGRIDEAEELFERLLDLRSDLGLLAEEWDPEARRQLGNFPQAFTHVALVNTAFNLDRQGKGPEEQLPA